MDRVYRWLLAAIPFLAGCEMVQHGTHSLRTTPLVVPGLNSAEDGWRPRIASGDAYHRSPYRTKAKSIWKCQARVECKLYRVFGNENYSYRFVTAYGDTHEHVDEQMCKRISRASAISACVNRPFDGTWPLSKTVGEPIVTCAETPIDPEDG
jgi:hypothetical protein